MSDSMNQDPARESAAEHVLREGLKATVLSPQALLRIRQATEQEWRTATRGSTRRWKWPLAAAASAAFVSMSIAYLALNGGAANGAILGEVSTFDAPGMIQARPLRRDVALAAGAKLRVGQSLEVRGDSLVTLAGGGNLRAARATAFDIADANVVGLEHGELYVDIPPGSHAGDAFRVVTDAGEFRHEGTQFAVAVLQGQTRLRVREGRVLWHADSGDSLVDAGTEVIIDRNGKATRRSVATAGRDWTWTESLAPDIAIEDRPLLEFLEWYARETGRKLVIDDAARRQAADIRMHGSVNGLTVSEALSAVMAATSLRYELPEGVIRVSSTREPRTPSA